MSDMPEAVFDTPGQTTFNVPFEYLRRGHVELVMVDEKPIQSLDEAVDRAVGAVVPVVLGAAEVASTKAAEAGVKASEAAASAARAGELAEFVDVDGAASRAEAAADRAAQFGPRTVKDADEFFSLSDFEVGRYGSQEGLAWDVVASGGDYTLPGGVQVKIVPIGGKVRTSMWPVGSEQAALDYAAANKLSLVFDAPEYETTGLAFGAGCDFEVKPGTRFIAKDPGGRPLKDVTAITQASPCVVTCVEHGFADGAKVQLSAIAGMTWLNGGTFTITVVDANSFGLNGVDATNYPAYTGGGKAQKCFAVISCSNGMGSRLTGADVDANGVSGVIGYDLGNFRHVADLRVSRARKCAVGFWLSDLAWNTSLATLYATDCDVGYLIDNASNAPTITQCSSDSRDATNQRAGIEVRNGVAGLATVGVNIIGGFHQNTRWGVFDGGYNTHCFGTYFERCSEADVFFGPSSRFPDFQSTHHSSTVGTVCYKGRYSTAASIRMPALVGERSGGLFDFDATNAFAKAWKNESSGTNTAIGVTTGLALHTAAVRVNSAGEVGISGEPIEGCGFSVLLSSGGKLSARNFGASPAFGNWEGGKNMRWNATQSHRFYAGAAGSETEQFRVEANIAYFYGNIQNAALPTHADNAAAVSAGLPVGRFYKTAGGELRVRV